MKKVFSFVLVLVLVLSLAVAEGTFGKLPDDMTVITTEVEGLSITTDDDDEVALEEFDKLAATTVEGYFGKDVIARVKKLIDSDEVETKEFMAVNVQGYEEKMGNVKVNITFTDIEGMISKTAILIGLKNNDDAYSWQEYEVICADDGSMDAVFDSETLQRVQEENGLFALIVRKDKGSPSKTVADMTYVTTTEEGLIISIDAKEETALKELNKLIGSTEKEYFGEEVMGKVMQLLGKDEVVVAEFVAIYVENYKEEIGGVVANVTFSIPAREGQKVVVLLSLQNNENSGYEWKEYEGIGAIDGSVELMLDSEMLQLIQVNTGLLTLVV